MQRLYRKKSLLVRLSGKAVMIPLPFGATCGIAGGPHWSGWRRRTTVIAETAGYACEHAPIVALLSRIAERWTFDPGRLACYCWWYRWACWPGSI